jgi:hypothetical protein
MLKCHIAFGAGGGFRNLPDRLARTSALYAMLLFIVPACFGAAVFAQEEEWQRFPYALGAGLETNMNTRRGWAQGYAAVLDRHLFDEHFLLGFRGGMNTDYQGISTTEGLLFFRLYPYKPDLGGAFTQLGWGVSSFQEDENKQQVLLFEFSAGFRFFFLGGFYVEPYMRTGFPFQLGAGVLAGHRFSF